jgi:hypothetical protein
MLGLAPLAGCGRRHDATPSGDLTFEQLSDTAGLSSGTPILKSFDAYRMESGALRVKGTTRLPEDTNLRVSVKRAGEKNVLAMTQVTVRAGAFDSGPIIGESGPLPTASYEFGITAMFLPDAQPREVLHETDDGRRLRGPGMRRTQVGTAMFWVTEEMTR